MWNIDILAKDWIGIVALVAVLAIAASITSGNSDLAGQGIGLAQLLIVGVVGITLIKAISKR